MSDLTDFLLARIADDESKAAHAAHLYGRPSDTPPGATFDTPAYGTSDYGGRRVPIVALAHMSRWEPARVLAECDAKRRMIAEHQRDGGDCSVCTDEENFSDDSEGNRDWYRSAKLFPCPTLRLLALPYADHPDYDEAWRP